jgi:hypothetical protein
MQVFSRMELLTWIVALVIIEVLHLKWIWLSEWSCGRCAMKNVDCACEGRWLKYF